MISVVLRTCLQISALECFGRRKMGENSFISGGSSVDRYSGQGAWPGWLNIALIEPGLTQYSSSLLEVLFERIKRIKRLSSFPRRSGN